MKEKFIKFIENIVDNSDEKKVDIICLFIIAFTSVSSVYVFISSLDIINTPIIKNHSPILYSSIMILTLLLFFLSMLGDKINKPSNRPKVFLFITIVYTITAYSLMAEIFNYTFTSIIDYILISSEIPSFLIQTNARIFTVFLPLLLVILVFSKAMQIPFNKLYSSELLEYKIDLLTKNVNKITDKTMDIKICESIESGKPIIVPEKITFRHTLLDGSSGSGKTALSIRPQLSQILYRKSFYREMLKRLTFEALKEELCYLKYPVTNKFINDNFDMKYIEIYEDKKEKFLEKFKDYIIGVRADEIRLNSEKVSLNNKPIHKEIPISIEVKEDVKIFVLTIEVYINNMIKQTIPFKFRDKLKEVIETDDFSISIDKKPYTTTKRVETEQKDEEGNPIWEEHIDYITKTVGEGDKTKIYSEYISIDITPKSNIASAYTFNISLDQKGEGKIIYRNVGVTVIAPDGGLAKDTVEIADENGIKVYKIDPKMEEIAKGNISKFNPLLVGTPEKVGDILSSTLIAMEQSATSGNGGANAYYTNASIRAIRNVTILLKVMYPIMHNGKNPVLTDILDVLNNFSLAVTYVERMKQDEYLRVRWKTVIDYFVTSFYPPVVDETGKPVTGQNQGTRTKKTEEAISGIVNQLDNFLGREEIRYIFCDRENSINFADVLENGDCIAVSTRQSELGDVLGKAFALMLILSIQNSVLGRYSEDENPEIPYHLIIDEFPFYINDQTKVFFTFCRKYKVACTVAIQNLGQLEEVSEQFRQVIFTNTTTKIVLPGANVEDREYFCKFFGVKETFEKTTAVNSNPVITENAKYSEAERGALQEKDVVSQQELAELQFKRCYYSTVDSKGKNVVGKGTIDFLKLTEHNTIVPKQLDFEQFNSIVDKIKSDKEESINREEDINSEESMNKESNPTPRTENSVDINNAETEKYLKHVLEQQENELAAESIGDLRTGVPFSEEVGKASSSEFNTNTETFEDNNTYSSEYTANTENSNNNVESVSTDWNNVSEVGDIATLLQDVKISKEDNSIEKIEPHKVLKLDDYSVDTVKTVGVIRNDID